MSRVRSTLAVVSALTLGLAAATAFVAPAAVRASSGTVVISEFRARGPAGGNDEFVEIYNLSAVPVDVSGWRSTARTAPARRGPASRSTQASSSVRAATSSP